ncbi:MAG: hypothetical protein JST92_26595, partial [Deltaproteobacteria bacterium]|nr:hypothetical protein [Deltaproteobacteria bacterium]
VSIPSPEISLTQLGSTSSSSPSNTTVVGYAIGPEITLYSDANVYFSAMAGISRLIVTVESKDSHSDIGFASKFAVGKEWWVSRSWGLGVCGHLTFSANPDGTASNDPTIFSWVLGVSFSATFN